MSAAPAPAWFTDPNDPAQLRWWDGVQWTEHIAPGAPAAPGAVQAPQIIVAPLGFGGAAPAPAPVAAADPELLRIQREHLELERARLEQERSYQERTEDHQNGYRRWMQFQWAMSLFSMGRMFIRR